MNDTGPALCSLSWESAQLAASSIAVISSLLLSEQQ